MDSRYLRSLALAGALATSSAVADEGPVRTLGTVTVIGTRPTSLPTQIPTTIEGITGEDVKEKINAVDSEDALKYFPSLLVRKRYIGDYDHAVLATRASGTNNSARSLIYADGILLSNLLGNGATFTPRWGLVTPEQIERVDVLYGPFSAAYPGNSVGAVVDYVTRMPSEFEAHARIASFGQHFSLYRSDDTFDGYQAGVSVGNRSDAWSWWLDYQRLDSDSQPIVFANKLVSTGVASTAGTPVSGAVPNLDPRNRPWLLLGATNQTDTVQDHAKIKLAYDFSPELRASYTLGYWRNDTVRTADSYLREPSGQPYYGPTNDPLATSAPLNIDGVRYTLSPSDFAPTRADLGHFIHGLSIKSSTHGTWDWEVGASLYDYDHDEVRSPTIFVADADARGAGRIVDMHGTGWNTAQVRGTWRPQGAGGAHIVDLGLQQDAYRLRSLVSSTADWISGSAGARVSAFQGETRTRSVYVQDTWSFAPQWRTTLGVRVEDWKAFDGGIANGGTTSLLPFPERNDTHVSPKAALAYQASEVWALKASVGRAIRTPTVSELYQGSVLAGTIVNNDPDLAPEKSWTAELTAEAMFGMSTLRTTVFREDTRDALYSQVNVTAGQTVQTVQNVDHIRTTGVEVAYTTSDILIAGLDLSGSLTYAHSRILENDAFPASVGKWQPRVPDWRANLLATYRIGERWSTTLGARYSGTQYNQLDNSDVNGTAYTGLSNFFVIDARVRCRILPQVVASLGIDNLNNDNYWAFHPYPQRTVTAEVAVDF